MEIKGFEEIDCHEWRKQGKGVLTLFIIEQFIDNSGFPFKKVYYFKGIEQVTK